MFDLALEGNLNAPLNAVYSAFTNPYQIARWCAPNNMSVCKFMGCIKEGQQFRLVLQGEDGFQQMVMGTYHEVKKNQRLSFTWRWEDTNEITKVSIDFLHTENGSCKLLVKQSAFSNRGDMLLQQFAWMDCLEKLSLVLAEKEQSDESFTIQPQTNGNFFNSLPV